MERILRGTPILGLILVVAVCGYQFQAKDDYDRIEADGMVAITISNLGYGERSDQRPGLHRLMVFVTLFGILAAAYLSLLSPQADGQIVFKSDANDAF